ncbi:hypothetical protein ACMFMG_010977 [Clarireedia jacksonii]
MASSDMEKRNARLGELMKNANEIYPKLLQLHPNHLAATLEEIFNEKSKGHSEDQRRIKKLLMKEHQKKPFYSCIEQILPAPIDKKAFITFEQLSAENQKVKLVDELLVKFDSETLREIMIFREVLKILGTEELSSVSLWLSFAGKKPQSTKTSVNDIVEKQQKGISQKTKALENENELLRKEKDAMKKLQAELDGVKAYSGSQQKEIARTAKALEKEIELRCKHQNATKQLQAELVKVNTYVEKLEQELLESRRETVELEITTESPRSSLSSSIMVLGLAILTNGPATPFLKNVARDMVTRARDSEDV